MAIANLTPEAQKLLDKLSTEEREVIWGLVAPPASKKARAAYRNALTEYLVETFADHCHYKQRAIIYASLIAMADNAPCFYQDLENLRGEVIWLNCHEDDRLHAVMLAIKKLNSTLSFKSMDMVDTSFSYAGNGTGESEEEEVIVAPRNYKTKKVLLSAEAGEDHLPL